MSTSGFTTSPSFGALDWNVTREASDNLATAVRWINYFGIALELTVLVFFIKQFCDKQSQFRTPYYCFYVIGCFLDFVNKFFVILLTATQAQFLLYPSSILGWYNKNFITLWILLLSVNRSTAIIFALKFTGMWTKQRCIVLGTLLMLYPFISHCYNPIFLWCGVFAVGTCGGGIRETEFERFFLIITNLIFSFAGTTICAVSAIYMFFKKSQRSMMPEKRLLFQSLTSAILLVCYAVCMWLLSENDFPVGIKKGPEYTRILILQSFISNLGSFFYNTHHYASIIFLFVSSESFRTSFLKFFRIPKRFHCIKKNITLTPVQDISMHPEPKTNIIKKLLKKLSKATN